MEPEFKGSQRQLLGLRLFIVGEEWEAIGRFYSEEGPSVS